MPDLTPLKDKIDTFIKSNEEAFAVFDADGTLWMQDVNDLLLKYQIENNLRDLKDLTRSLYNPEKKRGFRCAEFVRRQAGLSLKEIKRQLEKVLKDNSLTVFPFQKNLMKYLKTKEVKIFVVTASMQWLVEEAVKQNQLPVDKVLGVQSKIKGEILTEDLILPVTYGEGKKQALLKETNNKKPLFAAGNSPGDLFLLEMASLSLVVNSASPQNKENFPCEEKMKFLARKKGWFFLDYLRNPPRLQDFSNLKKP